MRILVQGPRTRLARAIVSLPEAGQHEFYLLARDAAEVVQLADEFPRAKVVSPQSPLDFHGAEGFGVLVCAAGPLHAESVEWDRDCANADRDLRFLRGVVEEGSAHGPVRLVYVASVLACFPRVERAYYGGWKSLWEGLFHSWKGGCPCLEVAVLFPGRLVAERVWWQPGTWLHTSYAQAGRVVLQLMVAGHAPHRRLLGWDSRMLLLLRGFQTFCMVFKP